MNFNLFITNIEKKYYQIPKKLFLGRWCASKIVNTQILGQHKVVNYHWNDSEKLNKDYKFLYNFYYKILRELSLKLNHIHKTNKNQRYWHIIIGSWLERYLVCAFDRWECISKAFTDFKISNVFFKEVDPKSLIASDYLEFNKFTQTDAWNNYLIIEIIKFRQFKDISLKKISLNEKLKKQEHQLNKNLLVAPFYLRYLDKFLSYIQKKPKLALYKTYFGKKNEFLLYLKTKSIPRLHLEFEKKINLPKSSDREKIDFKFETSDNFEKFIMKNIFKNIPVSYFEGYKKLDNFCNNIKLKPNLFISAMSDRLDLLSIWIANKVFDGTKYFYSEHGGCIEDFAKFDNYLKKSDCFLSWNLSNKKNSFQISPQFYTKKIPEKKMHEGKNLCIILTGTSLYNTVAHYDLKSDQFLETYEKLQSLKNVDFFVRKKIKFRLHPANQIWSMKERIKKDFGKTAICKKNNINDVFLSSKIILHIDFQTAFYESMYSQKPVIVFTDRKFTNNINPKIKKLFQKFSEQKIIINDPQDLILHINNIWENPFVWWNNDKIKSLRDEFNLICSRNDNQSFINEILELQKSYAKN